MPEKWTEKTAKEMVTRNGGRVGINVIFHQSPGLRVLGAIDYLCNYKGHTWQK